MSHHMFLLIDFSRISPNLESHPFPFGLYLIEMDSALSTLLTMLQLLQLNHQVEG